jgi:hypothetical protein
VYVAQGHGLKLFDVSNPAAPILRGSYESAAGITDLVVAGGRAYLGTDGIVILDVSDPAGPNLLRNFSACSSYRLDLVGATLYSASSCGLQIIDVANPQSPRIIGAFAEFGTMLAVSNGVAYTSASYIGYRDWTYYHTWAVDVSNPARPALLYKYIEAGRPPDIWAAGESLYLNGVFIFDLRWPQPPVQVATLDVKSFRDMALVGDVAYVLEYNGLTVFDVSAPAAPVRHGHYTMLGTVDGVRVVGSTLYTYGPYGVQIIDVANPRQPQIIGEYSIRRIEDVEVAGSSAYVVAENGFEILDVSDPVSPTLRSRLRYVPTVDVEVRGTTAYLGNRMCFPAPWMPTGCSQTLSSLSRVDVSNPAGPLVEEDIHSYAPPAESRDSYLWDLDVAGDVFYAALGHGIDVYNQADGSNHVYPGYVWDVEVVDQRLFALTSTELQIYDASDPQALPLLGSLDMSWTLSDLKISGTLAYVASDPHGLRVVSVADPAQPHILASYDAGGAASDLALAGDLVFVAHGQRGAEILRYTGPSETVITLTPAGGSLSSPDGRLTLSFPAGAVSAPVRLTLLDYPRPPYALGLREHAVRTFALTATGADGPLAELAQPYALNLRYTLDQLHAQAVPEATLKLAIWTGGAWQDAPCGICVFSPQTHQLSVSSPTLGTFALRGRPFQSLMPVVQR